MKRCLMTMCFAALTVSAALAQGKNNVPPPPKPADDGPNLEVTMKFIQDKLNSIGPVNYAVYFHDDTKANSAAGQFRNENTKVVADPSTCRIDYHRKVEQLGKVEEDQEQRILLKDVEDIVLMPWEQVQKETDTAAGHPSFITTVDPPVFVLKVRRTLKEGNYFDFFDEQLANRVAKAMVHAVELCGGGSKQEPF